MFHKSQCCSNNPILFGLAFAYHRHRRKTKYDDNAEHRKSSDTRVSICLPFTLRDKFRKLVGFINNDVNKHQTYQFCIEFL